MKENAVKKLDARAKRIARISALVGVVLAIVCHVVPPKYQAACNLVAQLAPHACS